MYFAQAPVYKDAVQRLLHVICIGVTEAVAHHQQDPQEEGVEEDLTQDVVHFQFL